MNSIKQILCYSLPKREKKVKEKELFSEEDVNRLEEIIHLTHQMGINLAGVEMILKLQKKVEKMHVFGTPEEFDFYKNNVIKKF